MKLEPGYQNYKTDCQRVTDFEQLQLHFRPIESAGPLEDLNG